MDERARPRAVDFIAGLEGPLAELGLEIKKTKDQETGVNYYVLVRLMSDCCGCMDDTDTRNIDQHISRRSVKARDRIQPDRNRSPSSYRELGLQEGAVLLAEHDPQIEQIMTAPDLTYCISLKDALRCVKVGNREAGQRIIRSFVAKGERYRSSRTEMLPT